MTRPRLPMLDPTDRAVLAATDETLATGAITGGTWAACVEHVSDDPEVLLDGLRPRTQ